MEDDLNLFERGRKLDVLKNENNLKKIMQPETVKSKDNGCGTAPGNLVFIILRNFTKVASMSLKMLMKILILFSNIFH